MDVSARILVIEDDPVSQRVAKMMLEGLGYSVTVVANGTKALEIYQNYDLIVSDVGLPDINGIDICKIIRGQEAKYHIPMIALTANCGHKNCCKDAGFNKFLEKPVMLDSLQQAVEELLENKKQIYR